QRLGRLVAAGARQHGQEEQAETEGHLHREIRGSILLSRTPSIAGAFFEPLFQCQEGGLDAWIAEGLERLAGAARRFIVPSAGAAAGGSRSEGGHAHLA